MRLLLGRVLARRRNHRRVRRGLRLACGCRRRWRRSGRRCCRRGAIRSCARRCRARGRSAVDTGILRMLVESIEHVRRHALLDLHAAVVGLTLLPLLLALRSGLRRSQRHRGSGRSRDTSDSARIGLGCVAQDRFTAPGDEDSDPQMAPHGTTIAPRWRICDVRCGGAVTHPGAIGVQREEASGNYTHSCALVDAST